MPFESVPPPFEIEDFEDKKYYPLLKRLPSELFKRHIPTICRLSEGEAVLYLEALIEARKEVLTEVLVSDPEIERMFSGREDKIYAELETHIFEDHDNLLGFGTTARVKVYEITDDLRTVRIAVKYLVTPNEKTLSASGEHDMIVEVERLKYIEEMERSGSFELISVSHPYFYLKTQKIESYGMQLIDGPNLDTEQIDSGNYRFTPEEIAAIEGVDFEAINEEIDRFFAIMHKYCLHGDIKPRNWMMDADGKFYLIDFGQSILMHEFDDKAADQLIELKRQEVEMSKLSIRRFVDTARKQIAQY